MEKLFIVRHGNYGSIVRPEVGDGLNKDGINQMNRLSKLIGETVYKRSSIYFVSSSARRAVESTEVLINQLRFLDYRGFEATHYLWAADDAPDEGRFDYDLDRLIERVEEWGRDVNALVMVTHVPVIQEFSEHLVREEIKRGAYPRKLEKGESIYFDLVNRNWKILP